VGEAEAILGGLMKGKRHDLVVMSKVGLAVGPGPNDKGLSKSHVLREVENSLKRLQTDYLDVLFLHRPDGVTPLEETLAAFDLLVRQGKVRYIGVSNLPAWQVAHSLRLSERHGWERISVVQPEYSALRRAAEEELIPLCQFEGIGVTVYSPLARGLLSGRYSLQALEGQLPSGSRAAKGEQNLMAILTRRNLRIVDALKPIAEGHGLTLPQFALAWVLAQRGVSSAIVGATSVDRFTETLKGAEAALDAETLKEVDAIIRRIDDGE